MWLRPVAYCATYPCSTHRASARTVLTFATVPLSLARPVLGYIWPVYLVTCTTGAFFSGAD